MPTAYIGLGTNLGDRLAHLALATHELAGLPQTRLLAISPVYETDPVGPMPQSRYLNAAASIETQLDPATLRRRLAGIEAMSGRTTQDARVKWGPRTLDLDVLLYGNVVLDDPEVTVPHPRMHERWFVLAPLADLAPDLRHPRLGRTIAELLADQPPGGRRLGTPEAEDRA